MKDYLNGWDEWPTGAKVILCIVVGIACYYVFIA